MCRHALLRSDRAGPHVAPVKAPLAWPKSSLSSRSSGIAAQFTATNGPPARADARCSTLAATSLPVPVSPVINTVELVPAARPRRFCTSRMASLMPSNCGSREGVSSANLWIACGAGVLTRVARMRARSAAISSRPTGLVRCSKAPSRIAPIVLSLVAYAVSITTGTSCRPAVPRSVSSTERPSAPGSRKSRKMQSGDASSRRRSIASSPERASSGVYPRSWMVSARPSRKASSSSMIRMVAMAYRLQNRSIPDCPRATRGRHAPMRSRARQRGPDPTRRAGL